MQVASDRRRLGRAGLEVSAIGFGCMSLSSAYGSADEVESIATVHRAIDLGVTFFDTAEIYGPYHNEDLLGRATQGRRTEVVLATKFGWRLENGKNVGLDSSPARIRDAVEGSLKRLRTDYIDLIQQHRVDPKVPIEEVAGVVADLAREGKVRFFGLSEASPETIKRADSAFPVSTLQSEYSLWERGLETRILPAIRELGVGLIAFSPLGRGFLTGQAPRPDQREAGDVRAVDPRVTPENYDANMRLTEVIRSIAAERGDTASQVALAWVLAKGTDVVPIPGTRRATHLEENVDTLVRPLTAAEIQRLETNMPPGSAAGPRYTPAHSANVET